MICVKYLILAAPRWTALARILRDVAVMATNPSVIIVGGSLNGLSAALLLANRGVPCLVIERHSHTTVQYKFRGISPRSMEIYRSLGLEPEIRARDPLDGTPAAVARVTNLQSADVSWQGVPWSDTRDISPTTGASCDQDLLEPILRAHAEQAGARVRFCSELVGFGQNAHGVSARIRDCVTGHEEDVTASYLIAADGAYSPIREMLGIPRHGPGVLQHWMNVIFETDLEPTLHGRPIRAVFVTDINGTLVPRSDGRWLMAVQYAPEAGQKAEDFNKELCRDLIRRGAGCADLRVELVDVRPWEAAAAVADRYRDGRVFLVGDSAHLMPPTGGFGGNTGIHDTFNLAWKIDAVVRGIASSRLLDTYDEERRFIADRTVGQALARLRAWFPDPEKRLPPPEDFVADDAVTFGYRYPSGAFIPDDSDRSDGTFEDPRTPSGRPGARAPHLLVECDGQVQSTVDLFTGDWVLFAGPAGHAWRDATARMRAARRFDLRCETIGDEDGIQDIDDRWATTYHADDDGAVLIRPDGFVAWRGRDSHAVTQSALEAALERLAFFGA